MDNLLAILTPDTPCCSTKRHWHPQAMFTLALPCYSSGQRPSSDWQTESSPTPVHRWRTNIQIVQVNSCSVYLALLPINTNLPRILHRNFLHVVFQIDSRPTFHRPLPSGEVNADLLTQMLLALSLLGVLPRQEMPALTAHLADPIQYPTILIRLVLLRTVVIKDFFGGIPHKIKITGTVQDCSNPPLYVLNSLSTIPQV